MFTSANYALMRFCHDSPEVFDKTAYVSPYLPWVDMAIGVILCILGGIALHHGVIMPSDAATWVVMAGSIQLALATLVKCYLTCKPCCAPLKMAIEKRDRRIFTDMFRNAETAAQDVRNVSAQSGLRV